jgi:hypothetical protein
MICACSNEERHDTQAVLKEKVTENWLHENGGENGVQFFCKNYFVAGGTDGFNSCIPLAAFCLVQFQIRYFFTYSIDRSFSERSVVSF